MRYQVTISEMNGLKKSYETDVMPYTENSMLYIIISGSYKVWMPLHNIRAIEILDLQAI